MLLKMLVIFSALESVFLQSNRKWSDFQPVKAMQLELSFSEEPTVWTLLSELDYEQAGALSTHLKKTLKKLKSTSSYILAKGDHVIIKHSASGVSLGDLYDIPYGNSLGILSCSLGILLEGFRPAVVYQPMIDSLKGKDRNNPVFQHKGLSLFNILTTLPLFDGSMSFEKSKEMNNGLDIYGKEAMEYVNTILGKSKNEAWLDSFYAFGIEEAPLTSSGKLKIRIQRLLSYSSSIIHEFKISKAVKPVEGLPTVDHHYMFGWWLNCPNSLSTCLCSELPKDLVMSVTPSLRIYIVPSLELSLTVHSTQKLGVQSLKEMLEADESVWSEIRTFLENIGGTSDRFQKELPKEAENMQKHIPEPESTQEHIPEPESMQQRIPEPESMQQRIPEPECMQQRIPESERTQERIPESERTQERIPEPESMQECIPEPESKLDEDREDKITEDATVRFIHQVWPVLVFVFWVVSSHVWVYWMFHCCWIVATYVSKRTHIPRPKAASSN